MFQFSSFGGYFFVLIRPELLNLLTLFIVSLSGVYEHILVANQDGHLLADVRPLVRLNVTVIVQENGKREQGSMGGGGRCDYGMFFEKETGFDYAKEAVRQALVNLEAGEAPAGNMTVVYAAH